MRLARRLLRSLLRLPPQSWRDRLLANLVETTSPETNLRLGFPSMEGLLRHFARIGFVPETVLDVGAFAGNWSRMAAGVFPDARFLLFEANPDNRAVLGLAAKEIGDRATVQIQLLGPETRPSVPFFRMKEGSSVLEELTQAERTLDHLPMATLDDCWEASSPEPVLAKLDVQGYELEVLRGGPRTLASAEVVILETSLLPYNKNGPLLNEVVAFMADAGFVPYDICGQFRRRSDHTLSQIDVAFVKEHSRLRDAKPFWTHISSEQEAAVAHV